MSQRKIRKVSTEPFEISLHNQVFIPNVHVQYGAYSGDKNEEEDVNDGQYSNNSMELGNNVDEGVYYEDNFEIFNPDLEVMEVVDDETNYVEAGTSDIFDDSFLFVGGAIISKSISIDNIDEEVNVLLFEGSNVTLKEFCRYMKVLKSSQNLGDVAFSVIVGSILF